MTRSIKNERGFAMVYALVILILASVGGTALLFMVQKDHSSGSDYANVRSVSQAALTALKACEGQFLNAPDTSLAILKKYNSNHAYQWLLSPSSTLANIEQKSKLWNGTNAPQYSARIVGYDKTASLIILEGIGYGSNGGKKKVIATYQLGGLAMVATGGTTAGRYALYLARDGQNFNCGMNIDGDVYLGGTFRTQSAAVPIIINGNLKTGSAATVPNDLLSKLVVKGNAYFQCLLSLQNTADTIYGMAGFEKNVTLNANAIINDSVFTNASATGTGKIVMKAGKTLFTSGTFPAGSMTGGTRVSTGATISDIPARMGMCVGDTGAITIDITKIPASFHKSYGTVMGTSWSPLSATTMNTYYENHNNSTDLWNGYLVIKLGPPTLESPQWSATPGTFKYKVIWIINPASANFLNITSTTYWYNSSATSSSLIYLANGSQIVPMRWTGTLRAIIYLAAGGPTTYTSIQFGCLGQTLIGAMVAKTTVDASFEMTGASTLNITYNDTLVQNLIDVGLATRPATCGGGGGSAPVLTLVDLKIRPTRVSLQL